MSTPTPQWHIPTKTIESLHPACHPFIYRPISTELVSEMLAELARLKNTLNPQDLNLCRQVEIDMDNDLRRRVKDLDECCVCVKRIISFSLGDGYVD